MDFYSFMTQSELLLRIVVACICGCIIGYERESRNKERGSELMQLCRLRRL